MKVKTIQQLLARVEPWLAGVFFAYFLGFDFTPSLSGLMNASSYGVLILLIAGRWKQIAFAVTRDIPLLLLHLMGVASVLWSAAPEYTALESRTFIRALLFGAYLAIRYGLQGEMKFLARILEIGVVLSLIVGIALPSYGVHLAGEWVGAWKGAFVFKNLFAAQMSVAALLFILLAMSNPKRRRLNLIMLPLAVLLLLLSRGRTALAVFIISLSLIPLYNFLKQQYKWRTVLISAASLVSFITALLVLNNLQFIIVDVFGKDLDFNGRLPIWTLMIEKGLERPWLGYGYSGFWTSDAAHYILTRTWASATVQEGLRFNAHSGYIDLFLQFGFVGVFLYLLSLSTLLFKTFYLLIRTKAIEIFWVLQTLVFLTLINLADSISIASAASQWMLYVSFSILISVRYDRLKKDERLRLFSSHPMPLPEQAAS